MSVAIITGASSGLGCEFAKKLNSMLGIDEFWFVARREERMAALRDELQVKAKIIKADLCSTEGIDTIKALLEAEKPSVSYLVNAAGFGDFGSFDELSETSVTRMMDLHGLINDHNILFTLTVLGEFIPRKLFKQMEEKMKDLQVEIFSCFPSGAIQVQLPENVVGDVVHFSEKEDQFSTDCEDKQEPLTSCFVLNKYLPGYQISCYLTLKTKDAVDSTMNFVNNMSKLSWLSVKPLCERRTIAYPPHICALLRKNNANTEFVAPYEFLPMREKI